MRLVLAALVIVFVSAPADAQFRRSQRFAQQGDLALMAEVSGLDVLQLRPAVGGVGLRYRVADQTAVGLSIGLNGSTTEQGNDGGAIEIDNVSFRASTWFEQHVGRPSRTVSPFVGAGVQFNTAQNTATNSDGPFMLEQESSQIGVGGALLLGAEVRLARGVTFGGAYTLGVEYRRSEQSFTQPGEPTVETRSQDTVRFGTGVTNLAVSVYF